MAHDGERAGTVEAEGQEWWTASGVRLRRVSSGDGRGNWLFVPGGPGLGSESLHGLVAAARVPGSAWLVDLPGDGSNRGLPAVPADPYAQWPGVLAEAAQALDEVVMVGHSTGGMFLLSVPELPAQLAGLVLISSAPHAGWRSGFARYAQDHPLPEVDAAAERYARQPDDRTLRALTLAAAPWNFRPSASAEGRALLSGLPYCHDAVAWADAHFDDDYRARWTPRDLPTLIVSGDRDHVVDQRLWQDEPGFQGPHVLHRRIAEAGHFPWVENPEAVRTAFADLAARLAPTD
ncbi:alpha/beta fold hydrolase [Streptomyces caniferus]|uniref:alpha/beta fold hydrolase n=1 Tax=Streptomyces caniferus TaxID=285557 RepID=UPI001356B8DD|nr:alpha/beta hydrolase [Streptomyces caniferus]